MVLVVIDGLDASGKSTQALNLYRFLRGRGETALLRFHPSEDNLFGVKAREFLYSKGRGARLAAALFYMLDVIRSILLYSWRRYDYVIFVRYLMGTAYLPSPLHRLAYHLFASVVPTSDLMFFLNVSPEEAHRRLSRGRDDREMFESMEELKRVGGKALSLASMGNWKIIDADRPIDVVEEEIRRSLCLRE